MRVIIEGVPANDWEDTKPVELIIDIEDDSEFVKLSISPNWRDDVRIHRSKLKRLAKLAEGEE